MIFVWFLVNSYSNITIIVIISTIMQCPKVNIIFHGRYSLDTQKQTFQLEVQWALGPISSFEPSTLTQLIFVDQWTNKQMILLIGFEA